MLKCKQVNGENHILTKDCLSQSDYKELSRYLSKPHEYVVWGDHGHLGLGGGWTVLTKYEVKTLTEWFT